jgi:hypothetical protein
VRGGAQTQGSGHRSGMRILLIILVVLVVLALVGGFSRGRRR